MAVNGKRHPLTESTYTYIAALEKLYIDPTPHILLTQEEPGPAPYPEIRDKCAIA